MSKRRFLLYNSHTGKSRLVYPTMTATTRLYMCLIFLFGSLVWEVGQAAIVCPPMPDKITQVNRDVRSDIQVGVGSLGKIKAGEIATKTEVVAKNLFEKYPNIDRLLTVQMMAATYCSMIKDSTSMSEGEKQDRWEKFQERVFSFSGYFPLLTQITRSRLLLESLPVRNRQKNQLQRQNKALQSPLKF